jgi:hypothetical protein
MRTRAFLPGLMALLVLVACECGSVAPEGAGIPDPALSTITAEPALLPADGETAAIVTVTVLDVAGDPVAGVEVVLATQRGEDDVLAQPEGPTDEDGVAVGSLVSTVPGTVEITATAGQVTLDAVVEVVVEALECPEGTEDCGAAGCQPLGTLEHCTECDDACEAPAFAAARCEAGGCAWACLEGYASCDGDDATGCETELETGETTCPACTNGTVECDGVCVALGSIDRCTDCDDACTAPDDATAVCTETGCDWACDSGYGACDDADVCQPLGTLAHCTDCDDGCTAPENASPSCTAEGCAWACDTGYDTCEDAETCTPLGTVAHCEACDDACTAPENAVALCEAGGCTFECAPGWGNCDDDPSTCDGELDAFGACIGVDCTDDEVYCPGHGCVELGTVEHCLGCEDACGDQNATPTCGVGGCEVVCDEGYADCNQDPADGCEVDLAASSCCEDESIMVVTETCLTADVGSRLVALVQLVDGVGAPVSGASVTIDGGGLVALDAVATGVAGTYWIEFEAPAATGTFDITASAEAGACGAPVAFGPVSVDVAAPVAHGFGGTGGCSPRGGNLRVRVVDESGLPLEGAFVMAGQSAGDVLHDDAETWLAGGAPAGANTATTDADGYVSFLDYGDYLRSSSLMVTAGAEGYAYASWAAFDAGDLVIALEPLAEIPERVSISGLVTNYVSTSNVRMALVTQDLDVRALSSFQLTDILEDDKTVTISGTLCFASGSFDVPGNIHFPNQSHVGCSMSASPPDYLLSPIRGPATDVAALQGEMSVSDALGATDSIAQMVSALTFRGVGLRTDVETDSSEGGVDVALSSTLDATMLVSASNAPVGDLYLLSIGDLDALGGMGRLYLQGVRVGENVGAHSATLTTARDEGAFTGVHHLAMAISLVDGQGASAVLDRTTTTRADDRVFDDFFGTPGASVTSRTFSWQDVSLSTSPADYHVARSILRRMTPAGDYRNEQEPFWIVYTPAGVREFTLPDLPDGAPRAADGGYLVPSDDQQNRWFLGLYYQGLLADPAAFDPADWASGSLETSLTHISLSESTLP